MTLEIPISLSLQASTQKVSPKLPIKNGLSENLDQKGPVEIFGE